MRSCFPTVSDLYAGRTSDKQATVDCKILQLLEAGDSVMADNGFDIDHDLPAGTTLNIPPFLKGKDYLEPQEEIDTSSNIGQCYPGAKRQASYWCLLYKVLFKCQVGLRSKDGC